MRIEISRPIAMYDEPIGIQLAEFRPNCEVRLLATARDELNRRWDSSAVFEVGSSGAVDLATQAPISGSYRAADAMGLLWSMELDSAIAERTGFINTKLDSDAVTLDAELDGTIVATAELARRFIAPGVARTAVRDDGLVGTFFHHEDGARPGVIVVGGSGGGMAYDHPALLARHGFAVLSLAYFALEGLPSNLIDIPLEYFEKAIAWMRRNRHVVNGKLAVIGQSRGGELVLLLGATFPEITAVVAYVPSGVVWPGLGGDPAVVPASWTWRGKPIPFMAPAPPDAAAWSKPPVVLTPWFLESMKNRESAELAAIAVEKINGPVLMFSGTDDQMWPSRNLADFAMRRLDRAKFPHPYAHVSYAGAGHMIRFPYTPVISEVFHPIARAPMALGGTPEANHAANLDSWHRCLEFLDRHLK